MSRPVRIADIPTPALIVDVAALERNLARMAAFFSDGPCRLRPHVKAHKTPEIARRQLAAGGCVGLTCATIGEAEWVSDLCDDLLIANELIGPGKCERAARLASRLRQRARERSGESGESGGDSGIVTVAVDSVAGARALSTAATGAGVTIGVLVDVNVGQERCGVLPGDEALTLARQVAETPGLRLRGVMGYEGHVQPVRARDDRALAAQRSMMALVATADLLRENGLPCEVVSAGGTGTYDLSGRFPGVTEIQAGSYALMDTDYREVGVPFEQAFWALGTVISRPVPTRCAADCGHKAVTKDHALPAVAGIPGARITALNDEHAVIAVPADAAVTIGDRIRLVPSHTDPTINLHDKLYAIEGERVVDVWPVAARGYRRVEFQ
jgi:D-serine deaminase-like pyridoxal phosphate-dependent protein